MKLTIENLEKSFEKQQILKNCNFTFKSGKIYGLLGRNGSGKTTLFNCLSRTLPFENGEVYFSDDNTTQRVAEYDDISFVFTQPHLPEFMTGYEFLRYFIDINREKIGEISLDDAFKMVDFKLEDAHKLIKGYSHGMQNKLQMLTSLLLRPPVILMDEPLTSFDVVAAHNIKQQIESLRENHIVIFSTHILQLAKELCDELVLLKDGELHEVKEDLSNPALEERIMELLQDEEESHD